MWRNNNTKIRFKKFDDRQDDYPHEWYLAYKRFTELMDGLLADFDACEKSELEAFAVYFLEKTQGNRI